MGYETKEIAFEMLYHDSINQVLVKPSVFELLETTVTANRKRGSSSKVKGSLSADEIINRAIARIPENYPQNPFALIGYYRDYQFQDNTYINLNEGLIKVMDRGFSVDDYQSIQFAIMDYASNLEFKTDSFAAKPYDYKNWDKYVPDATIGEMYAPNELVLLFIHDAIRNHKINSYSYVHRLVKDFVKEHRLKRVKNTTYDNQKVYQINISKKEVPFLVEGTIYIDYGSFAIRKLDYAVYRQKLDESLPSNYSTKEKELLYDILVEYQDFNRQMYLNYISFHNQFKLIRPAEFFVAEIILDPNSQQVILNLNKPPANWLELNVRDFKLSYQGRRLRVREVKRLGETGNVYALSMDKRNRLQRKRLTQLFSKIEDEQKPSLSVVVDKMRDANGNALGERKSELINQFREFFTQKIDDTNKQLVPVPLLVKKKLSLGDTMQPKVQGIFNESIWMNTPLKTIP